MLTTILKDAIATCETALEQGANFAAACNVLGNILQSMGKFEDAMDWHTHALATEPNCGAVYVSLAKLYTQQEQWQHAIAAYDKALARDAMCEAYWQRADLLHQLGKLEDAIDGWFQALAFEPDRASAEGYFNLGNLFLSHAKPEQAAVCYERAIVLNSKLFLAYHNLGEVLTLQGKWQEAIDCYRQAIECDPNPAWAYQKLGDLLFKQGQLDEAIVAFRHCIESNEEFPWAYHNLIAALLQQERWDEALATVQDVIALHHGYPWAYTQLGRALWVKGDGERAIAAHQKAHALRGWNASQEKGYQFTQDWFSHNIPIWEDHLHSFTNTSNVKFLEIGSYQGMSACWMLDRILTHPTARLTCIDPGFQAEFHHNLAKTGAAEKVIQFAGNSHDILPTLLADEYDVIYIDGCHFADHVKQDAILCWRLLKVGGFMIFDDYLWSDPNCPGEDPQLGIDVFIKDYQNELAIVHQGYQVIVRKH